jgi:hypothetical protein
VRDRLDNLIADLARLDGAAEVGALDPVNAEKLKRNEFGTPGGLIQPRPTLTVTTDAMTPAINRSIARQVGEVIDGKGRGTTGQEIVGDVARALGEEVQNAIDGNTPPALAPSTIASRRRRGKDTRTLVDSKEMLRSIKVRTSADPRAFEDGGDG